LIGTGGVADEIKRISQTFPKPTESRIFYDADPARLIDICLASVDAATRDLAINTRG
jgi:hypothetical protein